MDLTETTYPFSRPKPFDMQSEFAWIRANDPVTQVRLASGDSAWLVTRYDDVRHALSDARFSRGVGGPGKGGRDVAV